ncbi:MAG: acylneuraminate cytidylyltransferase family protein [Anaerolineae bacterium]|nr:acylneuraminate cytidylyltransferase family protein [Anaerolineae bacterium]
MSILGVIPARGGSKSIPRKNIKPFLGKPLLAWTAETALQSGALDRLILSTDDEEIAQVGKHYGAEVPFLRPAELAQDSTPTPPVLTHLLEYLQEHENWLPDFVMVLEPTSPTRRPFHIRQAAELLQKGDCDTVLSVSEVPHHYHPRKILCLQPDATLLGIDGTHPANMIHRRQDLKDTFYATNGLIFACKAHLLLQTPPTLYGQRVVAHIAEPKYALDLDRPEDWATGEARLQQILADEKAQKR